MYRIALVTWLVLAAAAPSLAQQPETTAATTREEAIAAERANKLAELWPERTSPMVDTVNRLVERGFSEGLDSGKGANGPQIVLGGMRPGQGFTAGVGYRRSDLWAERLGYRATARATFQKAYLFDFNLDFQGLRTERTNVRWYTKYESSPDIDFYGIGNDSPKENHTSFAYDDLTTDVDAAYRAFRNLNVGFTAGYLHADSGRGHDDFTPIDELFPPDQLPGYNEDTQFTRIGAFVDFDYRDSKTGPRSGGVLGMRYREYWDIDRKTFAFRQTEYEFQQYIPYYNKGRVIAIRSSVVLTFPKEGNEVPIYLQPVLGGNDDLRGFGGYRFRDNHSVYLGVEHRWHASSNLEMSAFLDAGKVVPLKRNVDVSRMNYSGGIGFRVRVRSAIVSRTDFAVSREGFRIVWTFSDIFKTRW
ncbi:MAG TPA: BamA/TamA family outer membrane protein [Vicinamibacterales bacterium]|nr:BamA/TamA family outer membrane protein [Vicinamibacterales bacterium]